MKIDRLELRLLKLPLVHFFETSFGRIYDKHFVLIRVEGDGAAGWGECVAEQDPYYSSETNETVWHIVTEFIAPRVLGTSFSHPREIYAALKPIRGHNMAKAAIEMAAWDLYARVCRQPLSTALGGSRGRIASGVSVGIQDSLDQLGDKIERELAAGYRRIKVKIKPGWDIDAVEMIRSRFGPIPLMVDANAAYTAADALHLAQLDRFDLMMIEQPLEYDDVMDHVQLQKEIATPICLDESIHTGDIARDAIAAKACRIINIKPGRVGGFSQAIAIHDFCESQGIPVWCGGMLESGVGRAHNVALASLPNFTLPGDLSPSARYWERDIVVPEWTMAADGMVDVPLHAPGIGVEVDVGRIDDLTVRREVLSL